MKWISTLNSSDLESMKKIVELCKEEKASFQGSDYEITYLKNVISFLETSEVTPYLADLEEDQ